MESNNKSNNSIVEINLNITVIVLIIAAFFALSKSLFVVDQTKYAMVLRFGKPVRIIKIPGLKGKIPFLEDVVFFENRVLDLVISDKEIIASDQKRIIVNAFAKFQIEDLVKFYTAFKGRGESSSITQLSNMLESSLRRIVGSVDFIKLLSKERSEIMQRIEDDLNSKVEEYGINIKDVRIMRADLPKENSSAIYKRMQTERELEAKQIRAEGEEESRKIIADTDKEVAVMIAEAKKKADILKGKGESEAAKLVNEGFGKDIEFYNFYKSMQVYKEVINKDNTNFIITPNNEFFKELKF